MTLSRLWLVIIKINGGALTHYKGSLVIINDMILTKAFLFNLPDIDECSSIGLTTVHRHSAHDCHYDANCTNTKGSFYCMCHVGYTGDGVTCLGKLYHFWTQRNLRSNRVKRSPIDSINEVLINKKTELLVIVDIVFISAFQNLAEFVYTTIWYSVSFKTI